jgi:chorismate--pyruvate lyase
MGENPLGEKIFSDPQLDRSPIEWTQLEPNHPLYPHAVENVSKTSDPIYGRRSLFYGAAKPIMISEFFLPDIKSLRN